MCYISGFHQRKFENTSFHVDKIDPYMCTHLIYSMARINETTYDNLIPLDKSDLGDF